MNMNRSISLSVDSDLVKQGHDAVLLLGVLSMLPAGTARQNLRWRAPTFIYLGHCHVILCSVVGRDQAAKFRFSSPLHNPHRPVIYVEGWPDYRCHRVQLSCCQYVMSHICCFHDSTFSLNSKGLAARRYVIDLGFGLCSSYRKL